MTALVNRSEFNIEIDLVRDFTEICREYLVENGYEITLGSDFEIRQQFFNVVKRGILKRPREVLVSKEFRCDYEGEDFSSQINELKHKAESGEDLTPHLSRRVFNAKFNDSLLNNFGIHHFHLGTGCDPNNPKLIKGTKQLVFARVTQDKFYMIQLLDHNAWYDLQLLQIIYDNWPAMLEPFRVKGIAPSRFTEEQMREMMKENINFLITLQDGSTFSPPGGGSTTSGTAQNVTMSNDDIISKIRALEDSTKHNLSEWKSLASRDGKTLGPTLRFKLTRNDRNLVVIEEFSGLSKIVGDFSRVLSLIL
jgi:hypothetical protein